MSLLRFLIQLLWLSSAHLASNQNFQSTQIFQSDLHQCLDLDVWIHHQAEISWTQTLKNISPNGTLSGTIVASLSTWNPDYFYSWTRDSAIVLKEIVLRYEETHDPKLLSLIKQSISATQFYQSSSFNSNSNLGEPKFYVNGSAFVGPWGRPQRDGPALRATVYIRFALVYLSYGGPEALDYVKNVLYDGKWNSKSVIKADLEYISNTWNERSFDLWEEVNGFHFFTCSVIHRGLKEGSNFAIKMNDLGAARWYEKQADLISKELEKFWDEKSSYIRTSRNFLNSHGKQSGLDVGTLLGSLHAGREIPEMFRPQSNRMIDTFHAILKSMSDIYPINDRYQHLIGKAVGRYPEDIYDGVGTSIGNPWYITTLTMAEYIYRLEQNQKQQQQKLIINNEKFNVINQPIDQNDDKFQKNSTIRSIGDEFLTIVKNSISSNGSIHEQFHRVNGMGLGARDLTWSHVAFLSMVRARNHLPEF